MKHISSALFTAMATVIVSLAGCDGPGPLEPGGLFDPCLVDDNTAIGRIQPIQTETLFDKEVLDSPKPVLVCFYQTVCSACKKLAPRLSNVANSMPNITFRRTNADLAPQVTNRYTVKYFPTMIMFRNGMEVRRWVGLHTEAEMRKTFPESLAAKTPAPVATREVCTEHGCITIVDDPIANPANIRIQTSKQ